MQANRKTQQRRITQVSTASDIQCIRPPKNRVIRREATTEQGKERSTSSDRSLPTAPQATPAQTASSATFIGDRSPSAPHAMSDPSLNTGLRGEKTSGVASSGHDQYRREVQADIPTSFTPSDESLLGGHQQVHIGTCSAIQSGRAVETMSSTTSVDHRLPFVSCTTFASAPHEGPYGQSAADVTSSAGGKLLPANIIIFGESGVGKSSLINMLSGDANASAAVSNQALGCTFETEPYRVTIDEREYVLWDTAGLNEGSKGSVTADEACEKLVDLLKRLRGGVHLLVYVVRGTRLRSIVKINYDIFQRVVFRGQVPIVLVATGLENEDRMEDWWDENGGDMAGNGLQFDGHACVTTTKGKKLKSGDYMLEEEYAQSRDLVRALIKEKCLKKAPVLREEDWKDINKDYADSRTGENGSLMNMLGEGERARRRPGVDLQRSGHGSGSNVNLRAILLLLYELICRL